MNEEQRSIRLNHSANINIIFASGKTMTAHTKNMSDSGLLIKCPKHAEIKEGGVMEVIVLGIEGALPRQVKIVRIDSSKDEVAVKFVLN